MIWQSPDSQTAANDPVGVAELLSQPIDLGPVALANRLVISPHTVNFGFDRGEVGDDYIAYLTTRATGFGLTWVPLVAVEPRARAEPKQPWLWDERHVAPMARLAAALRATGTEPGVQLSHAGRQTTPETIGGEQPVAPSALLPRVFFRDPPRALTIGEVEEIVEAWARSARLAVQAGYRVIDLHFAHGYLVQQFLSPDSNSRDDQYGGSPENRARLGREIVRAVRDAVGPQVAVDVRINGADFVPGGLEIEDAIEFARSLVTDGADGFQVSGGVYGSHPYTLLLPFDGSPFLDLAAQVRAALPGVVVTGVGGIRTAAEAAAAVSRGACDLVAVARAVMADPGWARRVLGELPGPIRPCLGTLDGCSEPLRKGLSASCQVEPDLGRELRIRPRVTPARILVVGGGPAGCEAASYAAGRGHNVVLLERSGALGGALRLAAATPGGAPFGELVEFYAAVLATTGVEVRLATPLTVEILEHVSPDHVLLATGARPEVPPIDGIDSGIAVPDEDVLNGDVLVRGQRVVVLGAGRRAVMTALRCSDDGAAVSLIDLGRVGLARDASALMRRAYLMQLQHRGVNVIAAGEVALAADAVVADGFQLPTDIVVVSLRLRPNREAANLVAPPIPSHAIGDARVPRSIMAAIAEAREIVDSLGSSGTW